MTLHIAVELSPEFATAGEFLADARAYEAAGAEVIWLPPGPGIEVLTLLAAISVVTTRARLGASLATADPGLDRGLATLDRLSGDRLVLAAAWGAADALVPILRGDDGRRQVLVAGDGEDALQCAVSLGDGLVSGPPAGELARARELRRDASEFELWARVPAPGGRAAWRELLEAAETAGATGLIVAHAPNLLDILRNPEEDDRRDLAIAAG